ncbi:MAG: NfeD family protein [Blautia sp.]|nr:NfeD family protein [Blautia sp.]
MTEIMTMMMIWLVVLIVAVVVEVVTMGLTTIWFAGGALVAIVATLLHAPIAVQVLFFFIVSLLMLFFTRPVAVKYFNKDRVRTNVESMVGRQAIVVSEVNNIQGTGQVTVGGNQWSARSMDNNVIIPTGAVVNVMAINGVKLIVKADEKLKDLNPTPPSVPEPMSVSQMEELEEKQSE